MYVRLPSDSAIFILRRMSIDRSNLADFTYFLSIAKHSSFRRAGTELGVSASALSHSMKALESRLGVRLLNRTNRSVTLSVAGEALRDALLEPFAAIGHAVDQLNGFRDSPAGRIRLNVVQDAVPLILGRVMPTFVQRYPDIEIDLAVSNQMVDVTKEGFDAGIRYGGTVPQDMIAQRLSADLRWVVAASPGYLERYGIPQHPLDLKNHRCLRLKLGDGRIYQWEFTRGGETVVVDAPGTIALDESLAAMSFVRGGVGLLYVAEPMIAADLANGDLRIVLDEWSTIGPGYYMYYASRRHVPVGLRLLIELIQELRPLGL